MLAMKSIEPLEEAIRTLGAVLADRGLHYELAAIGGGSLMLVGLIKRPTKDVDIVAVIHEGKYQRADPLPQPLVQAVQEVAATLGLASDWLNAGPTDLLRFGLPEGFARRVEIRSYDGLTLHIAGRIDQIHLKLYAAVDQGPKSKHYSDLIALRPTRDELLASARWTLSQDSSPGFKESLEGALEALGVKDAEL